MTAGKDAHRGFAHWIFQHVIWDTRGTARQGFWRALWAIRRVLFAILGSVLLTRLEWVEHHPPDIAIVALIHFVVVLIGVALYAGAAQWFGRSG